MSIRVRVHEEALAELDAAAGWYFERGGRRLATRLLDAIDSALERVGNEAALLSPLRNVSAALEAKRVHVAVFPYYLVLVPEGDGDDGLVVVAFAHNRRRPGYWVPRVLK